jgi:hypothetical protein
MRALPPGGSSAERPAYTLRASSRPTIIVYLRSNTGTTTPQYPGPISFLRGCCDDLMKDSPMTGFRPRHLGTAPFNSTYPGHVKSNSNLKAQAIQQFGILAHPMRPFARTAWGWRYSGGGRANRMGIGRRWDARVTILPLRCNQSV